jgi:hypothetical protein
MLEKELRGERVNKTDHRKALRSLLRDRSDGAVELKHQNISAVLIELRHPWINGYKPRGNYQQLLAEVVLERITGDVSLKRLALAKADAPPTPSGTLPRIEAPPSPAARKDYQVREPRSLEQRLRSARVIDYFEREFRNRQLGEAGEELVVRMEQERLHGRGLNRLADQVEWVSHTRGDGAGFDVLSFEENGKERFIEVKTTSFAKETPFFVSRSEVEFSSTFRDQYQLYRLFTFRDTPRLYSLTGALEQSVLLEPVQFSARPMIGE